MTKYLADGTIYIIEHVYVPCEYITIQYNPNKLAHSNCLENCPQRSKHQESL